MKIFTLTPKNQKMIEGEIRKILKKYGEKNKGHILKKGIYKRKKNKLPKSTNSVGEKYFSSFTEIPLWKSDVLGITGGLPFADSRTGLLFSRIIYVPFGTKIIVNSDDIHFIEYLSFSQYRMSYSLISS